jgi:hypothetical protein
MEPELELALLELWGENSIEGELWGIRSGCGRIFQDVMSKIMSHRRIDVELPLQVGVDLSFHLVDSAEHKHALTEDTPRLVGIRVIASDLRGEHECGNK